MLKLRSALASILWLKLTRGGNTWSPYSPFTGAYWPSCKHFWTKWYQSGEKKVNLDGFDKSQKEKFHDPHSGRLSFSLLYMGDSVAGVIFLCSTEAFYTK